MGRTSFAITVRQQVMLGVFVEKLAARPRNHQTSNNKSRRWGKRTDGGRIFWPNRIVYHNGDGGQGGVMTDTFRSLPAKRREVAIRQPRGIALPAPTICPALFPLSALLWAPNQTRPTFRSFCEQRFDNVYHKGDHNAIPAVRYIHRD
jgi:hypothetical protein